MKLPAAYWTVWVGTLINRAGGFVLPLLTFYLTRERGMSLSSAGAIVALHGAGGVAAGIVGGVVADRIGRRTTMVASMLGGATLMFALALVRAPAAIAVLVLTLGFIGELYRPAVGAFVADVVPPEHRQRAYALLYWVVNIGFAVAALSAGLVARWSYAALFVIDGITCATYAVIVWIRLPETRPEHPPEHQRTSLRTVLADHRFVFFCFLSFLITMIAYQSMTTLAGWMSSQGHDAFVFGMVMAVNGITIVLLQPTIASFTGRFRAQRVLALAALLTGAGFALHGTSALVLVHVTAVVIWTLGEIIFSPTASAVIADAAPSDARGRYQGLFNASWALASCGGPLLGPFLLDHAGSTVVWGGCLILGTAVAAAFLVARLSSRAT